MSSQVDTTVPADDVKPDKSSIRNNFAIIKAEITALQQSTSVPRRIAFDDAQFDAV